MATWASYYAAGGVDASQGGAGHYNLPAGGHATGHGYPYPSADSGAAPLWPVPPADSSGPSGVGSIAPPAAPLGAGVGSKASLGAAAGAAASLGALSASSGFPSAAASHGAASAASLPAWSYSVMHSSYSVPHSGSENGAHSQGHAAPARTQAQHSVHARGSSVPEHPPAPNPAAAYAGPLVAHSMAPQAAGAPASAAFHSAPAAGVGASSSFVPIVMGPDGQPYVHMSQLQAIAAASTGGPGQPGPANGFPPFGNSIPDPKGHSFYTVESLESQGLPAGYPYGRPQPSLGLQSGPSYGARGAGAHGVPGLIPGGARSATVYPWGASTYDRTLAYRDVPPPGTQGPGARGHVAGPVRPFRAPLAMGAVPPKPPPKLVECRLCKLTMNENDLAAHRAGKKHKAAEEAQDKLGEEGAGATQVSGTGASAPGVVAAVQVKGEEEGMEGKEGQAAAGAPVSSGPEATGPVAKPASSWVSRACDVCPGIMMQTEEVFRAHTKGKRHAYNVVQKANGLPLLPASAKLPSGPAPSGGAPPVESHWMGVVPPTSYPLPPPLPVYRQPPALHWQSPTMGMKRQWGPLGPVGGRFAPGVGPPVPKRARQEDPGKNVAPLAEVTAATAGLALGTKAFREALLSKGFALAAKGPPFKVGVCGECGAKLTNEANFGFHEKGKRHLFALENRGREERGEPVLMQQRGEETGEASRGPAKVAEDAGAEDAGVVCDTPTKGLPDAGAAVGTPAPVGVMVQAVEGPGGLASAAPAAVGAPTTAS